MPKAKAIKRAKAGRTADEGSETIAGVRVTHPDRVLYAAQNVTKRTLIKHYLSVADRILPHLAGRPVSLVRCPGGSGTNFCCTAPRICITSLPIRCTSMPLSPRKRF